MAIESQEQAAVPSSAPSAAQTGAAAQTSPDTIGQTPPSVSSPDLERLEAMAVSLATVREKVEQLAAGQEQMAADIAKLKAAEQEVRQKISAALRVPPAPASKPLPTTAPPSRPPMPLH